jgi:hypothetical protein
VKRAFGNMIDTWRLELNKRTGGNVLLTTPTIFDPEANPILHGISGSFNDFKAKFYIRNDNFRESHVIGNPILYSTLRPKFILNSELLLQNLPDPDTLHHVIDLKISDFIVNDQVNSENIPIVMRNDVPQQNRNKIKTSIENSLRYTGTG